VVPGIPSAVAVPSAAGIPLTHRGLSSSFAIVTGHEDPTKPGGSVDWGRLATAVDTLVILMGVAALPIVTDRLIAAGGAAVTPAAVIRCGTTPAQEVVTGTLGDIARRAAHLAPPAVTVVGPVVGLARALHEAGLPVVGVLAVPSRGLAGSWYARSVDPGGPQAP
jgi:uroporphyrinogen III methyltransferase/synthase